jgi:hypothetical protein
VSILRSVDYLDAFETAKKRDDFFERLVFADGTEAEPPRAGTAGRIRLPR